MISQRLLLELSAGDVNGEGVPPRRRSARGQGICLIAQIAHTCRAALWLWSISFDMGHDDNINR